MMNEYTILFVRIDKVMDIQSEHILINAMLLLLQKDSIGVVAWLPRIMINHTMYGDTRFVQSNQPGLYIHVGCGLL